MTKNEKMWAIQSALDEIRAATGMDSVLLLTREQVGLQDVALMLFSSGVEDTSTGRNMLNAGLSFFPEPEDVIELEPDGRQRLQ